MMSEEELLRPRYQTNFKVEVKGQVQVQVSFPAHGSKMSFLSS